jgi:hypothetical protein
MNINIIMTNHPKATTTKNDDTDNTSVATPATPPATKTNTTTTTTKNSKLKKVVSATKKIGSVAAIIIPKKQQTKHKIDMRWEELQRIEKRRQGVLRIVEEPFWKILFHWDGTVICQISKDGVLWMTLIIFVTVRIGARIGLPDFVANIATGGHITTLGGFISFFLVFYVNQSHKRFYFLYHHSMACKGRIFDVATLARASLPSEEAFMWVLTAPLLLFKDSVLFSTESDNLIKNPTII